MGNVTISLFLAPDAPAILYDYLLADIGFAESIMESYFTKMETYESRLVGDSIELRGIGELLSSTYTSEMDFNVRITEDKVYAEFYKKGRYAEKTDDGIVVDLNFGPRFNIPLDNTSLSIDLPYDVASVSPEPDYINPELH